MRYFCPKIFSFLLLNSYFFQDELQQQQLRHAPAPLAVGKDIWWWRAVHFSWRPNEVPFSSARSERKKLMRHSFSCPFVCDLSKLPDSSSGWLENWEVGSLFKSSGGLFFSGSNVVTANKVYQLSLPSFIWHRRLAPSSLCKNSQCSLWCASSCARERGNLA